jgi:catalase
MSSPDEQLAVDLVDAANALYGSHPGQRALHARGYGLSGTFTPSGAGAGLTTAAHLVDERVPVIARFSAGTGDPDAPDRTHMPRGLAIRFETAAGDHDIAAVDSPVFLTSTPALFLDFLRLMAPDPSTGQPDQERLLAWLGEHPVTAANAVARQTSRLPASYAELTYYAIHAFELVGPNDTRRFVRFLWTPLAAGSGVDDEVAAGWSATHLSEELDARLAAGEPVLFDLTVQLADDGDDVADPAVAWPDERTTVVLGRLELTAKADVEDKIFDPTRVVAGIATGPDPVLAARSTAYGVSYARRTAD